MRNVLNLIAFSDPDDVPEVVLDDAEVVPVVIDVGREKKCVATPHDALLAQIGRPPVDFQTQLVRLHDFWRLGESLSKLCEESNVAVRGRLVVGKCRVGDLRGLRSVACSTSARVRGSFHVCWALSVLAGTT